MDEDDIFAPLLLGGSAWALRPDVLPRVAAASRRQVASDELTSGQKRTASRKAARRGASARAGGSVLVIPLCGILTPQGSFLSYLFGGGWGGLQAFRDEFAEAVNDPDVGAIVIDIDSPGGLVDLTPETAADIREARGSKPIVAMANTQACSGAYWIGSQADELVITPSGLVGSVGVYMVHEDWSKWEENFGVKTTFVVAEGSPYKVEGNSSEPLSDSAEATWQAEVDELMSMFAGDVATARDSSPDDVLANYGGGRVLLAKAAVAAGMADRVATLEEIVAELLDTSSGSGGNRSALGIRAELTRKRLAAAAEVDDEEEEDEDELEEELEDVVDDVEDDDDEDDDPNAPRAEADGDGEDPTAPPVAAAASLVELAELTA